MDTLKRGLPPIHPGVLVKEDCIEYLGLTITEAAKLLGVTRKALSELVNCKSGISPMMAKRLAKAFGSTPEMWLRLQISYDLWQLRDVDMSNIKRVEKIVEKINESTVNV